MDDFEIEILEDSEMPSHPPPLERGRFQRWGRPEAGAACVLIHQDVLRETQEHARSTPTVEVGGVLVGEVYQHDGQTYTEVKHYVFIPSAVGLRSSNVHFNFSGEVWTALNQLCDIQYPALTIVGWFHSHPNHGIFLSSMDLDVQRKAAYQLWQIAMVYDPQRHEGGIFIWRETEMVKAPGFYELYVPEQTTTILNWRNVGAPAGTQAPPAPAQAPQPAPTLTQSKPLVVQPPAPPRPEVSRRPPRPRRGLKFLFIGFGTLLMLALLLALAYLVYENNLRAQQSAFDATRQGYEAQLEELRRDYEEGQADSSAAVTTLQAQLVQSEHQFQVLATAASTAQIATLSVIQAENAAELQILQGQVATLAANSTQAPQPALMDTLAAMEALVTAQAATIEAFASLPTPTLAVAPSPTNTPTPDAPTAPPTVPITPSAPGGSP